MYKIKREQLEFIQIKLINYTKLRTFLTWEKCFYFKFLNNIYLRTEATYQSWTSDSQQDWNKYKTALFSGMHFDKLHGFYLTQLHILRQLIVNPSWKESLLWRQLSRVLKAVDAGNRCNSSQWRGCVRVPQKRNVLKNLWHNFPSN